MIRLLAVVGLLVLSSCERIDRCNEEAAYGALQELVKEQLRAPGSALFPPLEGTLIKDPAEACTYRTISHVDAQNSFGALLRMNFAGHVTLMPDGTWQGRAVVSPSR